MKNDKYDEVGRIRDINISTIVKSANLIKEGKVFDLGMEISESIQSEEAGAFPFRILFDKTPEDEKELYKKIEKNSRYSGCSEVIMGPIHFSTHIDALCHAHLDGKVIGKYEVKDIRTIKGWSKFGAEVIPPIVGRGVLIDIAKYLNKEKLDDNHAISLGEVKNCLKNKKIKIEFGDIVCIRTGKIQDYYKKDYFRKGPGISSEAAIWLHDQGMCVLGIDYLSVDPIPFKDFNNSTHLEMIYKRKIYVIESLNLEELSGKNLDVFFMVCSSPKVTGCSGSYIRPVAIV